MNQRPRPQANFWTGLAAPWLGLAFVVGRPAIWPLALVPAVLACILFVSSGWLFVHLSLGWLAAALPESHTPGNTAGVVAWSALRGALDVLVVAVSIVAAALVSLTLAGPLSAKPLEGLVRARDREASAPPYPESAWTASVARALGAAVLGLVVGLIASAVVGVLGFAFPPAALILSPLSWLISSYVVAWNLFDYPLGLRGVTLGSRARWMVGHVGLVTGFGLSTSVLLLVPGVCLLLLPAGVVGAAIVVEAAEVGPAP